MRRSIALCAGLLLLAVPSSAQEAGVYGHYRVYDEDHPPRTEYAERRRVALLRMDQASALVVRAAEPQVRSNDIYHEFRQRSNMLWLTGITEPECALLLAPVGVTIDGVEVREVLFVSTRNHMSSSYEGQRMGPDVAKEITGIATVLPYSRLHDVLEKVLPRVSVLYYDGLMHRALSEPILSSTTFWEQEVGLALRKISPGISLRNASNFVGDLRRVKSPVEIGLMRKAIDITVEAHRATMAGSREGMYEYELEAIMEYTFRRLGAESPGYPSIVGSGPNATVLHYSTNRRRTEPGELVVMDCGAEYRGYSADVSRTFPISGRFSPEQRAIYDLVLRAREVAIRACQPGAQFRKPHMLALRTIAAGLIELGLIADEDEATRYYPHGTSHFLGLDVHDIGAMGSLEPGMVLTVEPGIYVPEGSPCDPKWWNIGVRVEDDILITPDGNENLSAKLPVAAEEIEHIVQEGRAGTGAQP